jgi:hypothetical protein
VPSAAVVFEPDGGVGGEPRIGQPFDRRHGRALAVGFGPVAQHVAPVEGAGLARDASGRGHRRRLAGYRGARQAGKPAVEQAGKLVAVEAHLGGPGSPVGPEVVDRHVVGLGPAGLEGGGLGRARGPASVLGHALADLLAALEKWRRTVWSIPRISATPLVTGSQSRPTVRVSSWRSAAW